MREVRTTRCLLALLLMLLVLRPLRIPGAGRKPKFKAEVKVVNVLASVRNKKGTFVSDRQKRFLGPGERPPQTIRYFSRHTDLPLTLGLMIDTSMSQRGACQRKPERIAVTFLEQVLRKRRTRYSSCSSICRRSCARN